MDLEPPPAEVPLSKLNVLTTPIDTTLWNLGDVAIVDDSLFHQYEVIPPPPIGSKNARKRNNFLASLPMINNIGVVISCRSTCLIRWQNGLSNFNPVQPNELEEEWYPSLQLTEVDFEDFDFFPKNYVIKKDPSSMTTFLESIKDQTNDGEQLAKNVMGVVMSVDTHNEVCTVKWRDLDHDFKELAVEQNIPIYNLASFDNFGDFSLGSQVIKLPVDNLRSSQSVNPPSDHVVITINHNNSDNNININNNDNNNNNGNNNNNDNNNNNGNNNNNEEAWFGEIIGGDEGYLRVHWTNNTVTLERPDHLIAYSADDEDDEDGEEEIDEDETEEEHAAIEQSSNPVLEVLERVANWERGSSIPILINPDQLDDDNEEQPKPEDQSILNIRPKDHSDQTLEDFANFEILDKGQTSNRFFSKLPSTSDPKLAALLLKEFKTLKLHTPS